MDLEICETCLTNGRRLRWNISKCNNSEQVVSMLGEELINRPLLQPLQCNKNNNHIIEIENKSKYHEIKSTHHIAWRVSSSASASAWMVIIERRYRPISCWDSLSEPNPPLLRKGKYNQLIHTSTGNKQVGMVHGWMTKKKSAHNTVKNDAQERCFILQLLMIFIKDVLFKFYCTHLTQLVQYFLNILQSICKTQPPYRNMIIMADYIS